MKDEKKNKRKNVANNDQQKKVRKVKPEHQQEQEELFSKSDSISPVNKKADTTEVELNTGEKINLDDYIRDNYTGKATHFFLESFYYPIADLTGIPRESMKNFVKPLIVPFLKRFLLYGRFPNIVQARLYKKNKYTGYYSRKYWNYQWLTKKADLELREFIGQFEEEAKKVLVDGGNLKTFIFEYCRNHRLPIQPDMFEQK